MIIIFKLIDYKILLFRNYNIVKQLEILKLLQGKIGKYGIYC